MRSIWAWPARGTYSASRGERLLVAGSALAVAFATALMLPAATFQAKSIVAITDPASPLSVLLPRTAAEAAVSKPVMQRAAESLIETGVEAPQPDLVERAALALHLDGAKATGKASRLAAELSRRTSAQPGALPGSLEIVAVSDDPDRSAQIAAAVAEALVADEQETAAKNRRDRETDVADRIRRLQDEASAARRRLAALGGVDADPAQLRVTAAARTAAAVAHLDTVRAIIASGTPPLSDGRDVSAAIAALQSSYLDLSRRLTQARETLGNRHTTIISLQAEVKQAATSLAAEWRRVAKLAEGELASARAREAALRGSDNPADARRQAMLEEARRAVRAADDAVARAQAGPGEARADEHAYRMLSRPVTPNMPVGLSDPARTLLAAFAAAFVLGLCRYLPGEWLPLLFRRSHIPTASSGASAGPGVAADTAAAKTAEPDLAIEPKASVEDIDQGTTKHRTPPNTEPKENLMEAMSELLPELHTITPSFGSVPTIMVAANETGVNVTRVALALGRAVAENGFRVLLVETDRAEPALAAMASDDHDPVVVDLYGVLRVALRAETFNGLLYLAPSLKQGARVAAALARGTETPLIDDVGEEFDLVVIDGGRAKDSAVAGWGADAYLRVGRFGSKREDAHFVETFDGLPDMLLGTIVDSRFRKAATATPTSPPSRPGMSAPRSLPKAAVQTAARPAHATPQRRPSVARRKLGGR